MPKRIVALLFCFFVPTLLFAAEPDTYTFDRSDQSDPLTDWNIKPQGTVSLDTNVNHSGNASIRFARDADSEAAYSVMTRSMPVAFTGSVVRLGGWIRTEAVTDHVGLWLRFDGDSGTLALENMGSQAIGGTRDWARYEISLPVSAEAKKMFFGALLVGEGQAWVDDLELMVDGRPLSEAPKIEIVPTILDSDTEFVDGSGISCSELTDVQVENLYVLGLVWGFLKYHHPVVTGGERHWDFELFRILPDVLAAEDAVGAQAVLVHWIDDLGPIAPCSPCAELPEDIHLAPDLDWLTAEWLTTDLRDRLDRTYAARPAGGAQFYLGAAPYVGNPLLQHEPSYYHLATLDDGYRLLALYRYWNIIQYCFPYRDIIGHDWHEVLREYLPRMAAAEDMIAYKLELIQLVAQVNDTHAKAYGALDVQPPVGDGVVPVLLRYVESRVVVSAYLHPDLGPATSLEIADVILAVDGESVDDMITRLRPYYAASNEPTRMRDLVRNLLNGPLVSCELRIERDGEVLDLQAERAKAETMDWLVGRHHARRPGGLELLTEDIAYLNLAEIKTDSVLAYFNQAQNTRGLVLDCRSYPTDFPIFAMTMHLIDVGGPFVSFTSLDLANPGGFDWAMGPPVGVVGPRYLGRVAILVDETTQSSGEYHAMAFRASPGSVVLGSTTAAADGNVSRFSFPGGIKTMITGLGVFYPDKTPTQRVGIVPDIEVKPTVDGLRAGRDEVLERAMAELLERPLTDEEITKAMLR